MARQEKVIGVGSESSNSDGSKTLEWTNQGAIDTDLIASAGDLTRLVVTQFGGGTAAFVTSGPEMSEAWELSPKAITIEAGSLRLVFVGPNTPGNTIQDGSEPYTWRPADGSDMQQFITNYRLLSQTEKNATRLILDDDLSLSAEIRAGNPETRAVATAGKLQELYCIDPDFASTTGILNGADKEIKIFVEVAEKLEYLYEALPDGEIALPLLNDIPEIRIDDSFFSAAGDVRLSFDNRDGDFSRDRVGWYAQLWGMSFGAQKRLLFTGRVSGQTSSRLTAELVVSDLPIESLQREIPGRSLTQESFPNTRSPAVPVSIVFGRAIRLPCPHLDSGIRSALHTAAAAGDMVLSIFNIAGVVVGDRLSLSLGEVEAEIVTVAAIDLNSHSVTITQGLANAHLEGASVAASDIVEDYMLAEGVWSGGNFEKVTRVYHKEMALPEFICPDVRPAMTLAAGDHDFQLDPQHQVQFGDWYRNYFIEFISTMDGEEIVGSAIVKSYDPAANTVSITLTSPATDYTCYRMREYRFFNGSQATPHGGYAFIRLARRYQGQIYADVDGFQLTSPSQVLKELMTNSQWGAGETLEFAVENDVQNFKFEGAINSRRNLAAIVNEMGKFRPLRLTRSREGIKLRWQGDTMAVALPSRQEGYFEGAVVRRLDLNQRKSIIVTHYRPDLRDGELSREIVEAVAPAGTQEEIGLPFVYDRDTADRVAYTQGQRALSLNRQMALSLDPRELSTDIFPGAKVSVPDGILDAQASEWLVTGIQLAADKIVSIEAVQYRAELFTYPSARLLSSLTDSYDPPVDFSETPPQPLRNFSARTVSTVVGNQTLFECLVEFLPPRENYSGAQIWLVLGVSGETFKGLEDPAMPGVARFDLPAELTSYKVIGYSVNAAGNESLLGYPVEFLVNLSPTADAGDDRTVAAGARVTLDGSGSSDPDNDPLSYLWRQISGTAVTINNANMESASFAAPSTVGQSHMLEFELKVGDGANTNTDSVRINVSAAPPPQPPNPLGNLASLAVKYLGVLSTYHYPPYSYELRFPAATNATGYEYAYSGPAAGSWAAVSGWLNLSASLYQETDENGKLVYIIRLPGPPINAAVHEVRSVSVRPIQVYQGHKYSADGITITV